MEFVPCDFSQLSSAAPSRGCSSSGASTDSTHTQHPSLSWGSGRINLLPDSAATEKAHGLYCSPRRSKWKRSKSCSCRSPGLGTEMTCPSQNESEHFHFWGGMTGNTLPGCTCAGQVLSSGSTSTHRSSRAPYEADLNSHM